MALEKTIPMNILIIDDHPLFREGLSHILINLGEAIKIIESSNYETAVKEISTIPDIDLVLLDLNLPGKNGFELLSFIRQQYAALPVIILSASNCRSDIQQCLDSGARGFIPKETSSAIILNAIQLILSGGIYTPQCMTQNNHTDSLTSDNLDYGLTPRQKEVLTLLSHGHSNKYIAEELQLAESTIKVHITSVLRALGVSNRTQAVITAKRDGVI